MVEDTVTRSELLYHITSLKEDLHADRASRREFCMLDRELLKEINAGIKLQNGRVAKIETDVGVVTERVENLSTQVKDNKARWLAIGGLALTVLQDFIKRALGWTS